MIKIRIKPEDMIPDSIGFLNDDLGRYLPKGRKKLKEGDFISVDLGKLVVYVITCVAKNEIEADLFYNGFTMNDNDLSKVEFKKLKDIIGEF